MINEFHNRTNRKIFVIVFLPIWWAQKISKPKRPTWPVVILILLSCYQGKKISLIFAKMSKTEYNIIMLKVCRLFIWNGKNMINKNLFYNSKFKKKRIIYNVTLKAFDIHIFANMICIWFQEFLFWNKYILFLYVSMMGWYLPHIFL